MSFKPEVYVMGEWSTNSLRFATHEEATRYARDLGHHRIDLESRWMSVTDTRADESEDPVNHTWDHATRTLTDVNSGDTYVPTVRVYIGSP
jgi:hypothetical protein